LKEKISDWNGAVNLLERHIKSMPKGKKIVFLDELPWMDTAKSGFLGELGGFWNNFCEKRDDIILVLCGSAASYMMNKIIHNKGPLHGRITHKIPMYSFDLNGVKQMLQAKKCNYTDKSIVDIYMAFGGVAKYIKSLVSTQTPNQNINTLCFEDGGLLKDEYQDLFASLFRDSKVHYDIMDRLSNKWVGYTQQELSTSINISSTYIKKPLGELLLSGFIIQTPKFGQEKRDIVYRAVDGFSYFYNKWMKSKQQSWNNIVTTQAYRAWSGFAFENICHIHTQHIKHILGISGVDTQTHYWNYKPIDKNENGAQIDMLLEHTNGSKNIDIIECKYYNSEFTIDKKYKEELQNKIEVFNKQTKYKYNIRLILISINGIKKNQYYNEIVNRDITIDEIINVSL
jgi:hypothetical protein